MLPTFCPNPSLSHRGISDVDILVDYLCSVGEGIGKLGRGCQAICWGSGAIFFFLKDKEGMAGMQVGSRRTETKDLNSSSVSPSALVSFPSLSVTWLLYPFVFENMTTGAYKFHTFELSWMNNNMMTFSVQVERNLQKILRISLGQMISYYHVGYSGGGWGSILLERVVLGSYSNQIKSNWWWGQNLKLSITPKVFLQSPLQGCSNLSKMTFSPKLTEPGGTWPLLFSAWIITKRVAVSRLVLANTERIHWPSSFSVALSQKLLYFLICKGPLATLNSNLSPAAISSFLMRSQAISFHNQVLLWFPQACKSNAIWASNLHSTKKAKRRCQAENGFATDRTSVNGSAPCFPLQSVCFLAFLPK